MSSSPKGTPTYSNACSRPSPPRPGTAQKKSRLRASPACASQYIACPPPRRPVMIVSATHEVNAAATAASAADPPASRISTPASTVAGWPAATATFTSEVSRGSVAVEHFAVSRDTVEPVGVDRVATGSARDGVAVVVAHPDRVAAGPPVDAVAARPAVEAVVAPAAPEDGVAPAALPEGGPRPTGEAGGARET